MNRGDYNNRGDYGSNNAQKVQELLQSEVTANNYMRQMKRRWTNGDVYAPRDLSAYEMKGPRLGSKLPPADVVEQLGFSPLDNYRVCCHSFSFCRFYTLCCFADTHTPRATELLPRLRLHHRLRPDKALQGYWPQTRPPAQDRQDGAARHWPRHPPLCPQAPRDPQAERRQAPVAACCAKGPGCEQDQEL